MSADGPRLVSVLSQLLWSVGRVYSVPPSHPLISEDEEEVGGSVGGGSTKGRGRKCLRVRRLVAQTENRDCCYQLIVAGSNSGGWIKEAHLVFICRREHFRHNCTPIFSPFLKNVVLMLDNVGGKKVGSDPLMLDGSNITALLETRPREHKMMLQSASHE